MISILRYMTDEHQTTTTTITNCYRGTSSLPNEFLICKTSFFNDHPAVAWIRTDPIQKDKRNIISKIWSYLINVPQESMYMYIPTYWILTKHDLIFVGLSGSNNATMNIFKMIPICNINVDGVDNTGIFFWVKRKNCDTAAVKRGHDDQNDDNNNNKVPICEKNQEFKCYIDIPVFNGSHPSNLVNFDRVPLSLSIILKDEAETSYPLENIEWFIQQVLCARNDDKIKSLDV